MRKLHHPIAVFVGAVLAVIGIGVGVIAAATSQQVYGPSWGRFSVAFSGHVQVVHFGPIDSASYGDSLRYTTTFYYANQRFNGWVAYAPLSGVMLPTDLRAVVVAEVTRHVHGSELATWQIAHPTGGYLSGTRRTKTEPSSTALRFSPSDHVAAMASARPRLLFPTVGCCGTCWQHRVGPLAPLRAFLPRSSQ